MKMSDFGFEFFNKVKHHYLNNDPAHDVTHVLDVLDLALKMNFKLNLGLDQEMIEAAVLSHDIYADLDNENFRKNHHMLGYSWVKDNEFLKEKFSEDELEIIAKAVLEHRASFKGSFSSLYSELLNSADRGEPDLIKYLERSYTNPNNMKNPHKLFKHLKEKYGTVGYARFPELAIRYWGVEKILKLRKDIDNLPEYKLIVDDIDPESEEELHL